MSTYLRLVRDLIRAGKAQDEALLLVSRSYALSAETVSDIRFKLGLKA